MAKKQHNEVLVGITVLVAVLLAIYIVVELADWSGLTREDQTITVQLPYKVGLKGLAVGSPVYLGGAKIGQIFQTGIRRGSADGSTDDVCDGPICVFFSMEIDSEYPLRTDCVLAPESNMLGGSSSLSIKDVGSEGELITDGQVVDLELDRSLSDAISQLKIDLDSGNPSGLISKLKRELDRDSDGSLMDNLVATAANLQQISAKINEQVTEDSDKQTLIVKLHGVMDKLNSITERLNVQLDGDRDDTVMNTLGVALEKLDSSLAQIEELIKTNKSGITEMVASLKKAAGRIEAELPGITEKLQSALAKADGTMDQAKQLLTVNRPAIDKTIASLAELSTNLKMVSREVRRAPWKLIYKPDKDEIELQSLIDSAGAFASGAERLDDVSVRLHALLQTLESDMPAESQRIADMMAELQSSFGQFKKAEDKFWDELK